MAYFAKHRTLVCMWKSCYDKTVIHMKMYISYYIIVQQKRGEI